MQYNEDIDEINVQDLSKINNIFNKAGCGITNDESHLIGITIDQMSQLGKFKNIRYIYLILENGVYCWFINNNEYILVPRYWGKIIGLKRNYYILECDWKNKELEYKLRVIKNCADYSGPIS